ncbi:putative AAA domain-containing protein [Neolecta irregularis DAH-3]|uniref:Putative AAA domain-containing protein n=1 Tax=Neolecta irregularis (strain DAH-3) TaxID=1198029 RepID=A0A1U7LUG8_NEOID|nr:putative AAA domain-containing protein [Neolecta irregularis DAH-3]|eukprot:OLL26258.1 putative AAA domain-containing protein [Neolecta irregularis DAH-3]
MSDFLRKYIRDLAIAIPTTFAIYVLMKYAVAALDPDSQKKSEAKNKSKAILKRIAQSRNDLALNDYEEIVAGEVIVPEDINIKFNGTCVIHTRLIFEDIGGLDDIIDSLKESVIYPLMYPQLFRTASGLIGSPKGVLLYGPPGCGKTMLAKALAAESGATFINMHVSTLTDKWFGESNKLVSALFSLAKKLQPTIIFIDEIDSFLRERSKNDFEVTGMMKAEFMSLWDGLMTGDDLQIMVLGATNRPYDIDKAILRRMPKQFSVKLPDMAQRKRILELMLRNSLLEESFPLDSLVMRTTGLSGSDIKEIVRNAAMAPLREFVRQKGASREELAKAAAEGIELRPLAINDFHVNTIVNGVVDSGYTSPPLVEQCD